MKRLLCAFLPLALSGCIPAALTFGPLGLGALGAAGISTADQITGRGEAREDDDDRCAQLAEAQPYVAEVRNRRDGTIELRERVVKDIDGKRNWIINAGSQSDQTKGWRVEKTIAQLNFDPPLDTLMGSGHNYLVSAPLDPANRFEADQMMTFMMMFAPRSGNYEWKKKRYEFRIADRLPCFPLARK